MHAGAPGIAGKWHQAELSVVESLEETLLKSGEWKILSVRTFPTQEMPKL